MLATVDGDADTVGVDVAVDVDVDGGNDSSRGRGNNMYDELRHTRLTAEARAYTLSGTRPSTTNTTTTTTHTDLEVRKKKSVVPSLESVLQSFQSNTNNKRLAAAALATMKMMRKRKRNKIAVEQHITTSSSPSSLSKKQKATNCRTTIENGKETSSLPLSSSLARSISTKENHCSETKDEVALSGLLSSLSSTSSSLSQYMIMTMKLPQTSSEVWDAVKKRSTFKSKSISWSSSSSSSSPLLPASSLLTTNNTGPNNKLNSDLLKTEPVLIHIDDEEPASRMEINKGDHDDGDNTDTESVLEYDDATIMSLLASSSLSPLFIRTKRQVQQVQHEQQYTLSSATATATATATAITTGSSIGMGTGTGTGDTAATTAAKTKAFVASRQQLDQQQ